MKWILKILGLLAVWSIVVGIVIYVDPLLLRDVMIPGSYSPLLIAIFGALSYTAALIFRKKWMAFFTATLLTLTITLSMMQLLYWFVILAIIFLLLVVCYIHFSQ